MDYDLVIDHNMAKTIVNERGWDGFVLFIEQQFHFNFFSCSQDWYHASKYICKLKGRDGDVIIGWIGVHAPAAPGDEAECPHCHRYITACKCP